MSEIPEEVKQQINQSLFMNGGNSESEKNYYQLGAEYGYSLKCAEKDDGIERLKGLIDKAHGEGYSNGKLKIGVEESLQNFKTYYNL